MKMSSNTIAAPSQATAPPTEVAMAALPENDELEADDGFDNDSAYGGSSNASETTSVHSRIYRGVWENGRRYQTTSDKDISFPSDDRQFESMEAGHAAHTIIEAMQDNPFFRAPISESAQNVLDVGTGQGAWAIDVADRFPHLNVTGVDLYPPPETWIPPNCIFEVDDVAKDWAWNKKFDLVHLRLLIGAFSQEDMAALYRKAWNNLEPGGWIEHVECDIRIRCDDGSLPENSYLAGQGPMLERAALKAGNDIRIVDYMKEEIEHAGFVNVHERHFKLPVGDWPKHPIYKDAGTAHRAHIKKGLPGWNMFLYTKFGEPKPWTAEEVQAHLAKLNQELDNPKHHIYQYHRRVWAQKPLGTKA